MNPFQHFSFPLNVYAAMLDWQEQRVDYLHYGLFDNVNEPIWQAQARASEVLWAQMPAPGRVLEVGIGLGSTLARLKRTGFDCVGITPEPAQIDAVRARHGPELPVVLSTLEDLAIPQVRFDLLLLQESAQYIPPMALFEAAERLLQPEGATLLVMDEFALRRDGDGDFGLHLLPHFKSLASRFGWQLLHEQDVTPQALLTIDVLQSLTERFRPRLCAELGVTNGEIDDLIQSNRRYGANYGCGVFGYRLLRFERRSEPTFRPVSVNDAPADTMRTLFEQVFGRAMSPEECAWKYGDGRGRGIGLAQADGRLQAFCGGITRPLLMFGEPVLGCQVCDVMVEAAANASLVRHGPAHQAIATLLETEIGWARRHAVGFGFPNARALRLAERQGLYVRVDEMVELRWPALAWPTLASENVDLAGLDEGSPMWPRLQSLWEGMAEGLRGSVLGLRDPAWLAYRYGRKPSVHHLAWLIRDTVQGTDLGLVVARAHADHLEVLDLLAAPSVLPDLVQAARHHAAQFAITAHVKFWVTRSHQALFSRAGDEMHCDALDLFIPANAHTAGVAPSALAGRWYLTAGDTDFR